MSDPILEFQQWLVDQNRKGMEAFENGDVWEALRIHEELEKLQSVEFWMKRKTYIKDDYGEDPELVDIVNEICNWHIQRLLGT
jgi:hypothetical protein